LKVDKNDAVGISATPPPLDSATSNSNDKREGIPQALIQVGGSRVKLNNDQIAVDCWLSKYSEA
jgi:hypothetical protein